MSIVLLASGGLDSTLSAVLAVEQGLEIYPLFIDYGQIAMKRELNACQVTYNRYSLPEPKVTKLKGFGKLYPSSLTHKNLDIINDAFLPGRNMLFLLAGATYACSVNASSISIGLLSEELSLFPDQTKEFLSKAQEIISLMTDRELLVLAPLIKFNKKDVVTLAKKKGIVGSYSCHMGGNSPCGKCIACKEYNFN